MQLRGGIGVFKNYDIKETVTGENPHTEPLYSCWNELKYRNDKVSKQFVHEHQYGMEKYNHHSWRKNNGKTHVYLFSDFLFHNLKSHRGTIYFNKQLEYITIIGINNRTNEWIYQLVYVEPSGFGE